MIYDILREGSVFLSVKPEGKQDRKAMDINVVSMSFTLPTYQDIKIGDYVVVYGETYVIQTMPNVKEVSSNDWEYDIEFKGRSYELAKIAFMQYDSLDNLTETDFSIMGDAQTILNLVIDNANRVNGGGWSIGTCDTTAFENFPFSADNCLSVIQTIAEKFDIEWWIIGQVIYLTKLGSNEEYEFSYGKNKGLYEIDRTTQTDKNVCTRLYAYGSSDNIPRDYRNYSKRLKIPLPDVYLESNVDKYGIIEHVEIFDDVRPEFNGSIDSVSDIFRFRDSGIDFDISLQQIDGVKPKVNFLTGQLAGYQFEIGGFDNATKEVRILPLQDEKVLALPNDLLKPGVGDTYNFLDINMPLSYQTDAENRLKIKAIDYLGQNDDPWVIYTVSPDRMFLRTNEITPVIGNYYKLNASEFGLNDFIRLTHYTRDLQDEWLYTFDLQEVATVAQIVRSYNQYQSIKSAVNLNKLTDINRTRMNWKTSQELRNMVFDPEDGYFDQNNIRPLSIETTMLSVGAKSQQFVLKGLLFQPNESGDASRFAWSEGQLVHLTIAPEIVTWDITSGLDTGLTGTTAYYIYAKCSRTTTDGEIFLSPLQFTADSDPDYYYFWIGVLHSVIDGVRGISITYGQTTINGRTITTGIVQSSDGLTAFDLDNGIIYGKIQFGTDGGSTIIDGKLVTTSTLIMGDGSGNNVIITGILDPVTPQNSVVFAVGVGISDIADAPMRITADGHVVMTQADITGIINATSGTIANFSILTGQLAMNMDHGGGEINQVLIGDNVISATTPNLKATGIFRNVITNTSLGSGINYALILDAENADTNIALFVENGDVDLGYGNLKAKGFVGLDGVRFQYKGGAGDTRHFTVSNGIIVEEGDGG